MIRFCPVALPHFKPLGLLGELSSTTAPSQAGSG
jgi:hypothetical protein